MRNHIKDPAKSNPEAKPQDYLEESMVDPSCRSLSSPTSRKHDKNGDLPLNKEEGFLKEPIPWRGSPELRDQLKYYQFHRDHGYDSEEY